ncbi:hypothetical protein SAMN04488072_11372 [Lentibacillus halodurans]|uniref:Uncharacterized protein n=1 Tax=Lentibacillus halodurans TaxID=237679 RepID=A0A1I0ZVE8_9BACI|nr:hypothetical protein [Lentibacillus halodurans]SFB29036.1 hypothetical protein SAMN04488072_11372 [Lentibacillus halodurans]
MSSDQFYIYGNKQKSFQLHAERMVLYLGAGIIEAWSKNHEAYYLFFYKHDFLTAVKAKKLRRCSFIASAFKQGMVFNAPHPFIDELLSANHPCRTTRFEPLLKKLDKHYTPQEKAFILTFFESFISKKQLFNEITSIFYTYRRNGQNFLGYRIVRILMDFAPGHSLVRQLSSDWSFREYADLYHHQSEKVLDKDLIFAEKVLSSEKDQDDCFHRLITLLDKQSRWIDMMALYGDKLIENPSENSYYPLLNLLNRHFDKEQTMCILENLYHQQPRFAPLKQDLLQIYIELNKIEQVLNILEDPDYYIEPPQTESIGGMLEQLDLASLSLQPEQLQTLFKLTIDWHPEKAEHLIHRYTAILLNTSEPGFIKELLKPFIEQRAVHPIYLKVDAMEKFSDNLDQMQVLGELYYEFSQPEQAIECFSWEMELKPEDPQPLKWLSKIYQELGMTNEADAYRKLFINLQKQV